MGNYSILAIHGIGAGDGESRQGFSSNLRDLVFTDSVQRESSWHECIWEDLNDKIDNQISTIVQQLLKAYRKDWIKGVLSLSKRTPLSEEYALFPSPIVIEDKEVQNMNALYPMDVTESGMVTEVNEVHPSNAP